MGDYSEFITPEIREIENVLRYASEGHLRLVGGAVRDILLGVEPKDYDLATILRPEIVKGYFERAGYVVIPIPTGLEHGTVTVMVKGRAFEITTLRVDAKTDGRHAEVKFTDDWKLDAARRDFTINAMSIDMAGNLFDYFGGQEDLEQRHVRFVGDAGKRIEEDYLRILRLFRFFGRLGKIEIDQETRIAVVNQAVGLESISGERIWMEMQKILSGHLVEQNLTNMVSHNVMEYIGLTPLFDCKSAGMTSCLTRNPITILAAGMNESQMGTVEDRWKVSGNERKLLRFLFNWRHEAFEDLKFFQDLMVDKKIPDEWVIELAALQARPDVIDELRVWDVPVFPVTGQDLIDRGYTPGPRIGRELEQLFQVWINHRYVLDTEDLLNWSEPDQCDGSG